MHIKERARDEIERKLATINTDLNKIAYLEIALKEEIGIDAKKFVIEELAKLYEERLMFDKAGKVIAMKASFEMTFREMIEIYLRAGEMYAKAGNVLEAENVFIKALRIANQEQTARIKLTMKNIFFANAKQLELKGRKLHALKFYEKLVKMSLNDLEKGEIKPKLIEIYKALGKFREAKLAEGI